MKSVRMTRLVCMAAAFLLLVASPFAVQAASSRIDGYADYSLEEMYSLGQSGDPQDIELRSGDEIRIPLTADMFTWSDGRVPLSREAVTVSQLRSGRVRIRAQRIRGSLTLDYLQFDTDVFPGQPFFKPGTTVRTGRTAHISVILSREFAGTEDLEFEYEIYLTIDGERYEELRITLTGVLRVDVQEVGAGDDYVDLSEGTVIEASDFVQGITMDLGNGLSVEANLFGGERYRGICKIVEGRAEMSAEMDSERENLPELYPQIALMYKLDAQNIGSRTAAARTSIAVPGDDTLYHVYGEDLQYLGTTADKLAYSGLYILCTETMPQFEPVVYDNLKEPDTGGEAVLSGNEERSAESTAEKAPREPEEDVVYRDNLFA